MQKILIADDEAHIRRLVCDFLRREGYEPLEAEDGEQALSVLMKRVAALLRRAQAPDAGDSMHMDELCINEEAHEVTLHGKPLELTLKEYNLLRKLMASPGRVYTREQLLDSIWGIDYVGDIRTVDSHMARLRTKLGEWGGAHLKTVYGMGYKIEGQI